MSIPTISPAEAKRLLDQGATLIDIRGRDEHARERIEGARNVPVETLTTLDSDKGIAIFHCRPWASNVIGTNLHRAPRRPIRPEPQTHRPV